MIGPSPEHAPTIVMLHEGLGSVGLWGDFPEKLQAATGAGVFVYSRAGYGASTPVQLPRPLDYMHIEALDVLPKLLDANRLPPRAAARAFRRRLDRGDLCRSHRIIASGRGDDRAAFHRRGHLGDVDRRDQDGLRDHRAEGKTRALAQGRRQRLLRLERRLARSEFRDWDISEYLAYIRVPVAILQGADDQYGTMRQVEIAQEECYCPVDVTVIPGAGHSPHREAPEATLDAIAEFRKRGFARPTGSQGRAA